jgi:hypothetical protein
MTNPSVLVEVGLVEEAVSRLYEKSMRDELMSGSPDAIADLIARRLRAAASSPVVEESASVRKLMAERDTLRAKLEAIEGALVTIRDDPHQQYDHPEVGTGPYGMGVADGHRCAARKARAVLPAGEKGEGEE